jgi:microcystin-dependent protein
VQRELINIVQTGGLTLDPTNDAQVLAAIQALFLQKANNLSEIKAAGAVAQAAALTNLGISANLIPIGIPLPWPLATPPTGWLICNGASFSTTIYPNLAITFPTGILPDLRGEFIRGWDNGRGLDSGRALMSVQSHALQVHDHYIETKGASAGSVVTLADDTGITSNGDIALPGGGAGWSTAGFLPGVNAATETRPVNIAFNFIVRAA